MTVPEVLFSRFTLPALSRELPEPGALYPVADPGDELAVIGPYVDRAFYLHRDPALAAEAGDPVRHYHEIGWREQRWPNNWFDTAAM